MSDTSGQRDLAGAPALCPPFGQVHEHCRCGVLPPSGLAEPASPLAPARATAPGAEASQLGKDAMTARPEVVALLTDFDVQRTGSEQRFVHLDGRPFTAEETELIGSAAEDDMRAAAGQLAAAPERLAELVAPIFARLPRI